MTRSRAALLLVLCAAIVAIFVWRPWDPINDELRTAARDAARLPGVAAVDIERRATADVPVDKLGPEPREFVVTARLDAALTPDDAAVAAGGVHELLVPAAEAVAHDDVSVFLRVIAGEPEGINGVLGDPLEVRYSAVSGADDVADAFTIWQAGARRVNVYAIESSIGEARTESEPGIASDSPAGIGIEAADAADMAPLAELAAGLGRSADLHTSDGSARYSGYDSVPDVDAVRLTVAAASRPGVETVIFTHSTAPQLGVHAGWPADSPQRRELRAWLETHSYATTAGRPVAFTISGPGYATLTEGWVSAFSPPPPEPFTLPLPAGIDAWPDDADAAACAGADLELSYGGSDAATGARYAALLARNVSDNPCAVIGVPEIVFRNADGAAQANVGFEPYRPGVIPGRLVLPPGEQMLAALQWSAMSTANDPDVTTFIEVIALPGTEPVRLDVTEHASSPAGLDILDGAQVRVGPWVQALEGHS